MTIRKPLLFVMLYLIVCSACSEAKQTTNTIQKAFTSQLKESVYCASIHKTTAAFCTGKPTEKSSRRIFVRNLISKDESLLHEVGQNSQVMPVRHYGNQFVWTEYTTKRDQPPVWSLCTKNINNRNSAKTIIDNSKNKNISIPRFDIYENLIVLDYFTASFKDSIFSHAFLYNTTDESLKRISPPNGYDLYEPSFNGSNKNEIVCNLVSMQSDKAITRIAIYDLIESTWNLLDTVVSGFQPTMYGSKITYKECSSPYSYGIIQLYDIKTKTKTTLSKLSLGGETPQINKDYVVWESPAFDKIPAFDLKKMKYTEFDVGTTGKPYLKGNSLIWIATDKQNKTSVKSLILE